MIRSLLRSPLLASRTAAVVRGLPAVQRVTGKAFFSDGNITYSGGQAVEGQGGFYGSGGARATGEESGSAEEDNERKTMLAMEADVHTVSNFMQEFEKLNQMLEDQEEKNPGQVTGRSIELKAQIKKLMTNPQFSDTLNRLEIHGEPVWGLSTAERELVFMAREKMNEC